MEDLVKITEGHIVKLKAEEQARVAAIDLVIEILQPFCEHYKITAQRDNQLTRCAFSNPSVGIIEHFTGNSDGTVQYARRPHPVEKACKLFAIEYGRMLYNIRSA